MKPSAPVTAMRSDRLGPSSGQWHVRQAIHGRRAAASIGVAPVATARRARPGHTGAVSEQQPDARGPIEVVVEIPAGSRNKYEYDHEHHRFVLDRVLYSSVHYPGDYGFIEDTLADDGDPLDVLVLISEATFPGCVIRARPVGVLDMFDDKGHDYKILAVAHDDPRMDGMNVLEDLSPHRLREIEHFFDIYKELEGREVVVRGWHGLADAWRIIDESVAAGARLAAGAADQATEPGTWR
jgi:inorganic pyrophosphatase